MIEEVTAGGVVTKKCNTSLNPSVGQLVNNSSSAAAVAAANPSVGRLVNNSSSSAAVAAAMSSSSSSSSSLLHPGTLLCPRCNSPNTKFCYYNNRSHAQPRHFCRTCRRYWTQGGALRNVPIGGNSRRPKPKSTNLILSGGPSMVSRTAMRAMPYCRTSAHHLMALLWPNCGPNPRPEPIIGPINSLLSEVPNYYYKDHLNAVTGNVDCFAFASASASDITTSNSSSGSSGSLVVATTTRSASISESIPLMGSEFGYCLNSAFTWPHLPSTTGGSSTFP